MESVTQDPTEGIRRELVAEINALQAERQQLEASVGQVWNTEELTADFVVHAFLAPFISVTRKADGVQGLLMFQHQPRYYFSFEPNSR